MSPSAPTSHDDALSDEQLVSRTLRGHRDAFSVLVRRHEQRLFRFLSRTSSNPADVEDAMQHAFVKSFTKLATYNPKYQFTTWLYTIALRELRSLHRSPGPGTMPLADHHHPAAPPVADHAPGDTWAAARRLLNPTHFTALWLRYGEDLPARDIAKIMNRSRIWVSVTLHRACGTLREIMTPDGSPPAADPGRAVSATGSTARPHSAIRNRQTPDTMTSRGTP